MVSIGNLFNDFMNLIGLRYYNKEESDNNYATKTHTHTDYLTSHQDVSGKENTSNKKNEIPTDAISPSENVYYPTMNAVRNYAQPKGSYVTTSDSRLTDARTPTSHSHGNIGNDGKVGTDSGKIITTGTGGLLQASSSISKSMINDFPSAMTPTSHEHNATEVKDNSAYTSIGSSANSTQKTINDKINTALGLKADSNNVYSKSETYTQSEITTAISNAVSNLQLFEVVNTLPTSNIKSNRLYLIVNDTAITNNSYDIYLRVNNTWEQLDSLNVDVSNFYNKTEMDTLLNGKVDTSDSRLSDTRIPKSHSHGNISNTGTLSGKSKNVVTDGNGVITTEDKPIIPTKTSDLTNDSNFISTSSTNGLIKNDGSIDANTYLTTSNASSTYLSKTDASNTYQPIGNYLTSHQDIIFYEISSSDYNPTIDSSVTISVKAINLSGTPVANHSFVLNANGTNVSLTTSNSNGIATYTYTCSSWGLHTFSVGDNSIQIKVTGWKTYRNDTYKIMYNDEFVKFIFSHTTSATYTTSWTEFGATPFDNDIIKPPNPVVFFVGDNIIGQIRPTSTKFRVRALSGSSTQTLYGCVIYPRR